VAGRSLIDTVSKILPWLSVWVIEAWCQEQGVAIDVVRVKTAAT
jgi:hypothetical protein